MSGSSQRRAAGAVTAALLLCGCSSTPAPAPMPTPGSPATSDAASPSGSPSPSTSTAGAGAFQNPVFDSNFPDPMLVKGSDGYLVVATNGNGSNVQTLVSDDLTSWEQGPDALPKIAGWSTAGKVWAPEVTRRPDGRYLLYYTTPGPNATIQCVSVAVAAKPEGPFVDSSKKPLVCDTKSGGSIDASPFTAADGKRYLYWKNDGNAIGVDTYLWGQQVDASGTKLVGKPTRLFKQDQPWEGNLVEAPFGWERDGTFHLFYSANDYGSDAYAVGRAVADSPLGPFTKDPEPVLVSNEVAAGPGHCALFTKDGKTWMVYHAWSPDAIGADVPGRTLWLSEVIFDDDGSVTVVPPTVDYPTKP